MPTVLQSARAENSPSRKDRPSGLGKVYALGAGLAVALSLAWMLAGREWPIRVDRDLGVHDFRTYYLAAPAVRVDRPFYDSDFEGVWTASEDSYASLVLTQLGSDWTSGEVPVRYVSAPGCQVWTRWVAPYLYPPTLAVLMTPVTLLRFPEARTLWLGINLTLLIACAWLFARTHGTTGLAFGFFLLLLVLCPAVHFTLLLGQVNLIVFTLVLAAWRVRGSRVESRQFDLAFAIFALLATVTPSVAWIHHFIPATLAIAVAVEAYPPTGRRFRGHSAGTWVAYLLLGMPVTLFFKTFLGPGGSWRWLMSNTLYGALLLLSLLSVSLASKENSPVH